MKLTDKTALALLKRVRSYELEEDIEGYPENERDGRTDLEMLADEVGYLFSMYSEDGCLHKDDLAEAKAKLRRTNHGKFIPIDPKTMKPLRGFWESDIQTAKDLVNEVNRLKRLGTKLQGMGYYSCWWTF